MVGFKIANKRKPGFLHRNAQRFHLTLKTGAYLAEIMCGN
jgi:hypothetical protein